MSDTNQPFSPRELRARCVLSAIYLPDTSFLSGVFARDTIQDDSDNLISQSLYYTLDNPNYQVAPLQAQRLQSVSQSSGGLMPIANSKIGAPMCTFIYGGIRPSTVHSQLNLIQGPSSSVVGVNNQTYNPNFSSVANLGGRQGTPPGTVDDYQQQTFDYVGPQAPTIPSVNIPPFTSANPTPQTTYNIWQCSSYSATEQSLFNVVGDLGFVANPTADPTSLQKIGVARQNVTADGRCEISVNAAPNKELQLLRMFPISYDLAYTTYPLSDTSDAPNGQPLLFYPYDSFAEANGLTTTWRQIEAKGGQNCGFQMHFTVSQMNEIRHPTSGELNSNIEIEFGAQQVQPVSDGLSTPTIQRFKIKLIPDQRPYFLFYHPIKGVFEQIRIKGPVFSPKSKGGNFSVFVHFAGPVMMIGFTTDVREWNCIMPVKGDKSTDDLSKAFYPLIPFDAFVQVTFKGCQSTFEYGPIAFNNYNAENVTSTGPNASSSDLSYVTANFQVPPARASIISPANLNAFLQANAYNQNAINTVNNASTGVTYYPDWRLGSQQLLYNGTTSTTTDTTGTKYASTTGSVVFNTTIEGPQFLKLRNDLQTGLKPSISHQFSSWSDLTSYLKGFDISLRLEGTNRSYTQGTATVELHNLENNIIGHLISIAMRENQFVITLQAGYDELSTFFQGAIVHVDVTNNLDGTSVTKLRLKDIGTHLLDGLHFNQNFYFVGSIYQRIIQDLFAIGGLQDHLNIQEAPIIDDGSGNFDNFITALSQALGPQNIENSLVSQVIHGTVDKSINDVLKGILELVRKDLGFANLKFNFDEETFDLVWRLDPYYQDMLLAYGTQDDSGNTLIPDLLDFHGLMAGPYTESTEVDDLQGAFAVKSTDWVGLPLFDYRINPTGLDSSTLKALDTAIKNGMPFDNFGYVGFRKFFVDTAMQGNLLDETSLHKAADLYEDILFSTNQRIELEVYVTRPLQPWGTFAIQTFEDQTQAGEASDPYFYKEVHYVYQKGPKPITARISGERFSLSRFRE